MYHVLRSLDLPRIYTVDREKGRGAGHGGSTPSSSDTRSALLLGNCPRVKASGGHIAVLHLSPSPLLTTLARGPYSSSHKRQCTFPCLTDVGFNDEACFGQFSVPDIKRIEALKHDCSLGIVLLCCFLLSWEEYVRHSLLFPEEWVTHRADRIWSQARSHAQPSPA